MKNLNLQPAYNQAPSELYIVKGFAGDIAPAVSYEEAVRTAKMEMSSYNVLNKELKFSTEIEDGIEYWYCGLDWNGTPIRYEIHRIY